jgi:S1-C subfamily serine protease
MDLKVVTADRIELNKDRPEIVGEYAPAAGSVEPTSSNVKFGILLREASADERALTNNKRGVVVSQVEQGSFAEDIGIENRDIITEINRKPVNTRDDVASIAQSLKAGDAVTFHVIRPAQTQARTVRGRPSNGGGDPESLFLAGTLPGN